MPGQPGETSVASPVQVSAEGAGSIAVGGDAINSIFVTGGVNQFFIGQFERLRDAYLSPASLYRELQLDAFAGRRWLAAAIDDFVAETDRGWLLIEAEAGLGKTAFIAWVARDRRYVHHFVRLMPNADDVGAALRSLAAQLIRAWDLQHLAVGGVLPPNASRPDFFADLLFEAASRRDAVRPGEPIVIAVDGLHETVAPAGQNPLGLPADLPPGVYVVATQRTSYVRLTVVAPRRVVRIRADGAENLADVRAYLETVSTEPLLRQRLEAAGVSPAEFVDRLAGWSRGMWLVLRYALAELRSGARAPDDLSTLPAGLWQYYAGFWTEWQRGHSEHWTSVDLPLLATLTAVQEPVAVELLCEMSGSPDLDRAATLVGDTWRPFLQVQETGDGQERYAPFHDTLVEFVGGRVDPAALTGVERSFVRMLTHAQRAAHQRIADRYLAAWGGLAHRLPGLRDDTALLDDGYGLRQLIPHLVAASSDAVVHALMELEWPGDGAPATKPAANSWYEAHRSRRAFAGYALDVERAWAQAERSVPGSDGDQVPSGERALSLELRYALMAASVNSVAGNVSAELLAMLVDGGQFSAAQGWDLARQATDARARAEALTTLADRLAGPDRDTALREALAAVGAVPDGYWQAGELVRLIGVLPAAYHADVLTIVDGMREPYFRNIVRRRLAAHGGPAAPPDEPVSGASFMPDDPEVFADQYRGRLAHAVAVLAAGDPAAVTEPRWRAELLVAKARAAAPGERPELLAAALTASLTIGDRGALVGALHAIAAALAQAGDADGATAVVAGLPGPDVGPLVGAERWDGDIDAPTWRVQALAEAGELGAALALVDDATDLTTRVTLLLRLAAASPIGGRDALVEAQQSLARIGDPEMRRRLVQPLAIGLADAGMTADALDLVGGLAAEADRADALAAVAPLLRGPDLATGQRVADGIVNPVRRGEVLAALVPPLVASGAESAVVQVQLRDALHLLAAGTRTELSRAVPALLAGLVRVAGPTGPLDLAAAFTAAYRWWP
jgi:hypothetical protein